jgi:tRNA-specific adenosine deaminase 3
VDHFHGSGSWSIGFIEVVYLIAPAYDRFIQERLTPVNIERDTDLAHLKRVRRAGRKTEDGLDIIDIILCAGTTVTNSELADVVKDAAEKGIQISPRLQKVSRWPAYTTKQLMAFKALWPMTLRKDSSRTVKDPTKEARKMKEYMMQVIALAAQRKTTESKDLPISALLVDPRTSKVLLTANDTRVSTSHPLKHAIMNLLNDLPSLLPGNQSAETPPISHNEEEQYYASMYDVYITHEPCTMCCMALVHSRIRRLIFWKGTVNGAREIGWMKGDEIDGLLNHRFMCFEGIEGALGESVQVEHVNDDTWV